MGSSGGESSLGGVVAGEESAMQTPKSSVLERMRESLDRLEMKEKQKEKEEKQKEKEEKQKKEKEYKEKGNPWYDQFLKQQKEKEERAKASKAAIMAAEKAMRAENAKAKAAKKASAMAAKRAMVKSEEGAEKAKANSEEGVASANAQEGAEKAKTNVAEEGRVIAQDITRAKTEEIANTTADVALGKAQEAVVKKMSKAQKAKKKAASKMKAMAERAAWVKAREAAMTTKERAREAAKIAESKAQEAEEAAKIAKSKAQEAEEAAKVAESMADEAAKAKETADEVRRLEEKVTEWAQCPEELFATEFRSFWNKLYTGLGATFQQTTSIPAMRYTYPDSGCSTKAMETLQVMSVKVTSIKECLHWPLEVFGIIAVRDVLDHKRNIIFHRPRSNCQTITQDDCCLALTGPTRAIAVSTDPSYIEVSLKVKGGNKSEDKDLSEFVVMFRSGYRLPSVYPSRLSTLEFECGHIGCSVEATVCIKIIGGSWPDGFRGVFSAGTSRHENLLVKLLDSGHDGLPVDADGVIKLSRRVVSVELVNSLKVSVMACPINTGLVAESSEAVLKPQRAGVSPPGIKLSVGSCSMEVSVAWSCFRHELC